MVNKYFEELKLYGDGATENEDDHSKWYYIGPSISLVVLLIVIILVVRRRRLRKQKRNEASAVYTIPVAGHQCPAMEYIYQPVYRNQRNPIYLVPYSALPEDFDFSRPDVTVRGDYIILKDLHILEQPVYRPPSTPTTPTTPAYLEEFKKQAPYNPAFMY